MPNEVGDLFIDITQIKNITQDISSSYGDNPKSTFLRDNSEDMESSNNSISETSGKSNTQKSLKTEDLLSPEYWEKKRDAGEVKDASEDDWFDEYVDQVKVT